MVSRKDELAAVVGSHSIMRANGRALKTLDIVRELKNCRSLGGYGVGDMLGSFHIKQ
jgi:hypothetical protein